MALADQLQIPSTTRVEDLELPADALDPSRAAAIYREHGCLVLRGLMKPYLQALHRDIEAAAAESLALLDQAQACPEGWTTPNGTLFIKAPPSFNRDKQIMVLRVGYTTSAAFFQSALNETLLDVVEAILGPDIELFMDGQCLYKEPVGGHAKNLHQDAAYFTHRFDGPVAALNYVIETNLVNGALYVVPGSHKMGLIGHIDTSSHLGLDEKEWPWERAVPLIGQAGDTILFHVNTIHGSQSNHSAQPRPVFIHRYRRADDFVTISATTEENRRAAERHVGEASKLNQQGFMVRGYRKYTG